MTVEPKRQKRPYSYYEKTINEYSYRSMERVSKTCPEKVEALLLRFRLMILKTNSSGGHCVDAASIRGKGVMMIATVRECRRTCIAFIAAP